MIVGGGIYFFVKRSVCVICFVHRFIFLAIIGVRSVMSMIVGV